MMDSGFGRAGDISRGNTLARWSEPAEHPFDNNSFVPIYRLRSGFLANSSVDILPFEIERGQSPTFGVPLGPKWKIIHAHSPGGRTIEPNYSGQAKVDP